MTTQTLILISYLAIITVLSHLMRKWCVGILLILPVPFIVQITANLGCLWILAVVVLTILDIRIMREKSVFSKSNGRGLQITQRMHSGLLPLCRDRGVNKIADDVF